jgi:hypothetical protein
MAILDLRCPSCAVTEANVFVSMNGVKPPCAVCGGARMVDWSSGQAPSVRGQGYGSFTPIDMGVLGRAETKEDFDRMKGIIEQRFPGHRIELEGETKEKKQQRVDELKHKNYLTKRAQGVDEKIVSELRAESKVKKVEVAEARVKQNLDPTPPKMKTPGQSVDV